MTSITARQKSLFFSRRKVVTAMGRKNAKALNAAGAMIRKAGARNVRKRKKPSKPGQGPTHWASSEKGNIDGLRRIIYYYDPRRQRVTVGPIKYAGYPESPPAPGLMERGGTAHRGKIWIVQWPSGSRWVMRRDPTYMPNIAQARVTSVLVGPGTRGESTKVRVAKRPFMLPARDAVMPKVMQKYRGVFK